MSLIRLPSLKVCSEVWFPCRAFLLSFGTLPYASPATPLQLCLHLLLCFLPVAPLLSGRRGTERQVDAPGQGWYTSRRGATPRQAQGRAEQDGSGPEQRWDPLPPVSGGA